MVAAVETMAWTGETPWHGLGAEVNNDLTPAQMLKAAGLGWTVSKRECFYKNGEGKHVKVDGEFALVRDSDDSCLSIVGSSWKVIQNAEAFEFFAKFVTAGKMTMETAGSLWGGRYVWALARIGNDFVIGGRGSKDQVRNYLLLMSPHVHGHSLVAQYTSIRVVCWNTLSWALGKNLKGSAGAFRLIHSKAFNDDNKARAELALGLATNEAELFQEAATLLSKKKAKAEFVEDFFCDVLKFDPKKADKKKDGEVREPRMLPQFRQALISGPGQQLGSALGTWWGALNAVTFVVDHEVGRERDTALKNAWLGEKAGIKRRAFDLAIKAAA